MILIIHMLQTGLKLVLDSTEEDYLVALLVSLSKLSFKSTVLISEQVPFPTSYGICCVLLLERQDSYMHRSACLLSLDAEKTFQYIFIYVYIYTMFVCP